MGWFSSKPIDTEIEVSSLEVTVVFYKDVRHLRTVFRHRGGNLRKAVWCKGFWDKKANEVHSIKDMKVLGHECFHVLGLIGDHE